MLPNKLKMHDINVQTPFEVVFLIEICLPMLGIAQLTIWLNVCLSAPRLRRENWIQYLDLSVNKCNTDATAYYVRIFYFAGRSIIGFLE